MRIFRNTIVRRPCRAMTEGITSGLYPGRPDYELALAQHDAYIEALRRCRINVTVLPADEEYPLTIECNVLYAQALDLAKIPQDLRDRYYPQDVPSTGTGSNCDTHTCMWGRSLPLTLSNNSGTEP